MRKDLVATPQKKRKKWPWVIAFLLLLAFIFYIFGPLGNRGSTSQTARRVTPEKGSLTQTVVGTGRLEYGESQDFEIPAGLKVDCLLVEAGDRVQAGDAIASFDPLSMELAISSLLEEIRSFDLAIAQASGTGGSEVVRSSVAGRVKAIFIAKDDLAGEVYQDKGALLLLSLDGRMAVEIETSIELTLYQKVHVELSDGRVKEGTVRTSRDGAYTITLTDNGPKLGDQVTVRTKEGDLLGSGVLGINSPLPVIATEGRISAVHIADNEYLGLGRALFTLDNLPASTSYTKLLADRKERQDQLDHLLDLKKTLTLKAETNGIIQSLALEEGVATGTSFTDPTAGVTETKSSAYSLVPDDYYLLVIQVDELDILSVHEGQKARVSFDAMGSLVFDGLIDQVASQALETGGMAKYPVRILIEADPDMRVGMSVTATITVDEKEDVLLIPVAALQESGGRVYVYTSEDEASGELSGEQEVSTGLSDGDRVEILEGLDENTEVYYRVATSDSLFPFGPSNQRPDRNGGNGRGPSDG